MSKITLGEALRAKLPIIYRNVVEAESAFDQNPTEENRAIVTQLWRRYKYAEEALQTPLVEA